MVVRDSCLVSVKAASVFHEISHTKVFIFSPISSSKLFASWIFFFTWDIRASKSVYFSEMMLWKSVLIVDSLSGRVARSDMRADSSVSVSAGGVVASLVGGTQTGECAIVGAMYVFLSMSSRLLRTPWVIIQRFFCSSFRALAFSSLWSHSTSPRKIYILSHFVNRSLCAAAIIVVVYAWEPSHRRAFPRTGRGSLRYIYEKMDSRSHQYDANCWRVTEYCRMSDRICVSVSSRFSGVHMDTFRASSSSSYAMIAGSNMSNACAKSDEERWKTAVFSSENCSFHIVGTTQ